MFITLTTDFGLKDPFVGIMKGVIARINPAAVMIDLTHGIPPQHTLAAAMILRHAAGYFPPGTIHVAVVDPGVGSARRPLLVEFEEAAFIGPDNGVLSLACEGRQPNRVVHLSNPAYHLHPTSATFHGRDIFAPVAAYLSLGISSTAFGETIDSFIQICRPQVIRSGRNITGEIIYIDNFGNLFSNIQERDLLTLGAERFSLILGELTIDRLSANYAVVETGQPVAIINSWGLLEVALNQDNAARRLRINIGDKIHLSGGGYYE